MAKRKDGKIFPEIIYMFICEEEDENQKKESVLSIRYKQRGKRFFTCLLTDGMDDSVIKAIQGHPQWSQKDDTVEWEKQSISILDLWKKAFLYAEKVAQEETDDKRIKKCLQNTLNASIQRNSSIYDDNASEDDKKKFRGEFREDWKNKLREIADRKEYKGFLKDKALEAKHCKNILEIQDAFSEKSYRGILKGERLNAGTAQKSLNLYLKYLWCLGKVNTPPHCTVDRVILAEAHWRKKVEGWDDKFPSWTEDCHDTGVYEGWIGKIKDAREAEKEPRIKSLAEWELYVWSSK